jgi:hypothetical protein
MINQTLSALAHRHFHRHFLTASLILAVSGVRAFPADAANNVPTPTATTAPAKLSRTVGLEIINQTVHPDKSVSLTFKWSEKGNPRQRTVVANDATIVVYNGKLRKLADLTDADFRAKAVATVGADGVTAVILRFGKSPLPKAQLTPAQLALLATLVPPATTASDTALDKRVNSIVGSLDLPDAAAQARVRTVLLTDLRAVRDAHNAGLQLDESVHQAFLAGLAADLTPAQVESVKDKLTNQKLPLTCKVYHQIIPNLKPEDDRVILGQLLKAREECLYVKNVDEMTPIFKKHKTEIELYLVSQGYDWDKAYKTFVEAQKPAAAN